MSPDRERDRNCGSSCKATGETTAAPTVRFSHRCSCPSRGCEYQGLTPIKVTWLTWFKKTEDEEIATVVRQVNKTPSTSHHTIYLSIWANFISPSPTSIEPRGLPIPRESDKSDDEEDSIRTPAGAFRRKHFLEFLPEIKQGIRRIHQQQSEIREKAEVLQQEHRERLDRLEEKYLRQFTRLEEEHQKLTGRAGGAEGDDGGRRVLEVCGMKWWLNTSRCLSSLTVYNLIWLYTEVSRATRQKWLNKGNISLY